VIHASSFHQSPAPFFQEISARQLLAFCEFSKIFCVQYGVRDDFYSCCHHWIRCVQHNARTVRASYLQCCCFSNTAATFTSRFSSCVELCPASVLADLHRMLQCVRACSWLDETWQLWW
jgi:hypothetical protein